MNNGQYNDRIHPYVVTGPDSCRPDTPNMAASYNKNAVSMSHGHVLRPALKARGCWTPSSSAAKAQPDVPMARPSAFVAPIPTAARHAKTMAPTRHAISARVACDV